MPDAASPSEPSAFTWVCWHWCYKAVRLGSETEPHSWFPSIQHNWRVSQVFGQLLPSTGGGRPAASVFILINTISTISPCLLRVSNGRGEEIILCVLMHVSPCWHLACCDSVVQESGSCLAFSIGAAVRKCEWVFWAPLLGTLQFSKSVQTGVVMLPHQPVPDDCNQECFWEETVIWIKLVPFFVTSVYLVKILSE